MGSFTGWIRGKVKPQDRAILFRDVVAEMEHEQRESALHEVLDGLSDDQVADIINTQADRLNDKGYDWQIFSREEEALSEIQEL